MTTKYKRISIGSLPLDGARRQSTPMQSYDQYRTQQQTRVSIQGLKSLEELFNSYQIDNPHILDMIAGCLELVALYMKCCENVETQGLLVKICRTEFQVDSVLLVLYDTLDQINDILVWSEDNDCCGVDDLIELNRLFTSIKQTMCTILIDVGTNVRITKEELTPLLDQLNEQWIHFTDAAGALPMMTLIIRDAVAKSVARGIKAIDGTLAGDSVKTVLNAKGSAAFPSLHPPFTNCGDGVGGWLERTELLQSALDSLSWSQRSQCHFDSSQGPTITTKKSSARRSGAAAVAAAAAAQLSEGDATMRRLSSGGGGRTGAGALAQVTVLRGGPGVGKSSLALAVAQICLTGELPDTLKATMGHLCPLPCYDLVYWMQMTPSNIYTQWIQLASALNIDVTTLSTSGNSSSPSLESIVSSVYVALSRCSFLLVFDSAEGLDSLWASLPPLSSRNNDIPNASFKSCDVIVTTRSSAGWISLNCPIVRVEAFALTETRRFLSQRLGLMWSKESAQLEDDEVESMVVSLHSCFAGLPLCLSLAASQIVLCRDSSGRNQAGTKYALGLFISQLKSKGVDIMMMMSCNIAEASSLLPSPQPEPPSPVKIRRQSVFSALTASHSTAADAAAAQSRDALEEDRVTQTAQALAATLELMINSLHKTSSKSVQLLGYMCLVNTDSIPRTLLLRLVAGDDDLHLASQLQLLLENFLIRAQNEAATRFYIHPLLQVALCEAIVGVEKMPRVDKGEDRLTRLTRGLRVQLMREWIAPLVEALDDVFNGSNGKSESLCGLCSHSEEVFTLLERIQDEGQEVTSASVDSPTRDEEGTVNTLRRLKVTMLLRLGESLLAQQRVQESLFMMKKRLTLLGTVSHIVGSEQGEVFDKDIADTLMVIGGVYEGQRCFDDALKMFNDALQIRRGLLSNNSEEEEEEAVRQSSLSSTLRAIGRVCALQKNYSDALAAFEGALVHMRVSLNRSESPERLRDLAIILHSIGDIYKSQSNFEEALTFFREALETTNELHRGGHLSEVEIAVALTTIGGLHSRMGKHGEALISFLDSLQHFRVAYGECDQEDVAKVLHNIGNTYIAKNQPDEALAYLQKALHMMSTLQKGNSTRAEETIGHILNEIGIVYKTLEQFDQAVAFFNRSLQIKRKIFANSTASYHPELSKTLQNLGSAYTNQGNYEDALCSFNESLAMQRQVFLENHYEVETTKQWIAVVRNLQANRGSVLTEFRKYIIDRASRRKPGFPYSKMQKIDAAKFVLDYVSRPTFRYLVEIEQDPKFDQFKGPLLHGQLGDVYRACCEKERYGDS